MAVWRCGNCATTDVCPPSVDKTLVLEFTPRTTRRDSELRDPTADS